VKWISQTISCVHFVHIFLPYLGGSKFLEMLKKFYLCASSQRGLWSTDRDQISISGRSLFTNFTETNRIFADIKTANIVFRDVVHVFPRRSWLSKYHVVSWYMLNVSSYTPIRKVRPPRLSWISRMLYSIMCRFLIPD